MAQMTIVDRNSIEDGLGKNQSVRHIMVANPETFADVSEKTVYTYIGGKLFDVGRGDLPFEIIMNS